MDYFYFSNFIGNKMIFEIKHCSLTVIFGGGSYTEFEQNFNNIFWFSKYVNVFQSRFEEIICEKIWLIKTVLSFLMTKDIISDRHGFWKRIHDLLEMKIKDNRFCFIWNSVSIDLKQFSITIEKGDDWYSSACLE